MAAYQITLNLEFDVEVEGTAEEWEVTGVYLPDTQVFVPFSPALQPLWNAIYDQASDHIQYVIEED